MSVIAVQLQMSAPEDRQVAYPITPADKQWAAERMKRLGMTKAQLARLVGVSKAAISILFDERRALPQRSSRIWPDIVRALGAEPATEFSPREIDDDRRAILENWDKLTPEERASVTQIVRSLTGRR